MGIQQIPNGSSLDSARGAAPVAGRDQRASRKATDQDRSDLSEFGRVMSKSAEEFQAAGKPREDRLQEFRGRLDEPVEWSDEVVGAMLQRLRSI